MRQIGKDILLAGSPMLSLFIVNVILDVFTPIYDMYPVVDIPMHLLGGYVTALSLSLFLHMKPYKKHYAIKTNSPFMSAVMIISLVASVAVLWEVYEFAASSIFDAQMQASVFDTVKDLVMGMIGAWIFSSKEHHSIFLTK